MFILENYPNFVNIHANVSPAKSQPVKTLTLEYSNIAGAECYYSLTKSLKSETPSDRNTTIAQIKQVQAIEFSVYLLFPV